METRRGIRILASVLIMILSCALFLYGAWQIGGTQILSRRTMTKVINGTSFLKDYGATTVRIVNSCIYRITGEPQNDALYLTEDTLPDVLDETQIKRFLIDKLSEYGAVLTKGTEARLTAEEILPLTEKIRAHAEAQTGQEITDEQMLGEIRAVFRLENMYAPAGQRIFRLWLGIAAIAVGVLLLSALYVIRRLKLFRASLYAFFALLVPAAFYLALAPVLQQTKMVLRYLDVGEADALVLRFVQVAEQVIRSQGTWFLAAAILPVIVMLVYQIDKARIRRLSARGAHVQ